MMCQHPHSRRCVWTAWLIVCAAAAAGCATGRGGNVRIEQPSSGRALVKAFPQACVTTGRNGEYDIVLLDEAPPAAPLFGPPAIALFGSPSAARPLKPMPLPPVRQVLHIHLYWKPLLGTTKNPAATNASIRWYVLGPDGPDSVLVYDGAGYVSLRGSGPKRRVIINDVAVALDRASSRGNLSDPIGQAMLSGSIVATVNEVMAAELLAEARGLVRRESLTRTGPNSGPPPSP